MKAWPSAHGFLINSNPTFACRAKPNGSGLPGELLIASIRGVSDTSSEWLISLIWKWATSFQWDCSRMRPEPGATAVQKTCAEMSGNGAVQSSSCKAESSTILINQMNEKTKGQ